MATPQFLWTFVLLWPILELLNCAWQIFINLAMSGVFSGNLFAFCPFYAGRLPGCRNRLLDGDETGIDCGGSCRACGVPMLDAFFEAVRWA